MQQRGNARSSLDARATVINLCTEIVAVDNLHTFCTYKAQPIRENTRRGTPIQR